MEQPGKMPEVREKLEVETVPLATSTNYYELEPEIENGICAKINYRRTYNLGPQL